MDTKIGFIGGGQMAEAMIRGIIESNFYNADAIYVTEPNEERRNFMTETYLVQG